MSLNCVSVDRYNEGYIFFGPDNTSTISAHFEVGERPVILTAVGLDDGTCIHIEQVFGCGPGDEFVPLSVTCNTQTVLTQCNTSLIIPLSGRYRMVVTNDINPLDVSRITVYARPQRVPADYGGLHMTGCGSCTAEDPNSHVPAVINTADGTVTATASGVDNQTFALSFNPVPAAAAFAASPSAQTILAAALCDDIQACFSDLHPPATITTSDGVLIISATGPGNQNFTLDFNPLAAAGEFAASPVAQTVLANALCDDLTTCIRNNASVVVTNTFGAPLFRAFPL